MTELNTTPLLPWTHSVAASQGQVNTSGFPEDEIFENSNPIILYLVLTLLPFICIFGLVGNGIVIWFLCFLTKKNPITTYILNLAAADSGVLFTLGCICIQAFSSVDYEFPFWLFNCFFFTYTISQYLLTAISIEKCLSVVFPIWYRCHRPKYLSPLICILLWIMPCVMIGMLFLPIAMNFGLVLQTISIINVTLCIPVVIICTILLFIGTYCSLYPHRHGKFYAVLLLLLLVFILFGAPLSVTLIFVFFGFFDSISSLYLLMLSIMCASINSSVNPLIYFLIGRKRMQRSRGSFKLVLQSIFSDATDCREGRQPVPISLECK